MTVTIGNINFEVPRGYFHIRWSAVSDGAEVYTIGTHDGYPCAYGPFVVESKERRVLRNIKNSRVFFEYPESLLVKEKA